MLKHLLMIIFVGLYSQASGQADFLDRLICYPDYGPEVAMNKIRMIKKTVKENNIPTLREVVVLDEKYRPVTIKSQANLPAEKTTDIIHIDYSRVDEGLIIRVDSIFATSPNLKVKVYNNDGYYVKTRKTDKKGEMVTKRTYFSGVTSTLIYVYDRDTLQDATVLIPVFPPSIAIDDFGHSSIKLDPIEGVYSYDTTENKIMVYINEKELYQTILFQNGLVQSIQQFGYMPTTEDVVYDSNNKVISTILKDDKGNLQESHLYYYEGENERISRIDITRPSGQEEQQYSYPAAIKSNVSKIIDAYGFYNGTKYLGISRHYTANGFLVWEGQYYRDLQLGKEFLRSSEYELIR